MLALTRNELPFIGASSIARTHRMYSSIPCVFLTCRGKPVPRVVMIVYSISFIYGLEVAIKVLSSPGVMNM